MLFVETLWSSPHVFDPSYRDGAEEPMCVCGLPKSDDVHVAAVTVTVGLDVGWASALTIVPRAWSARESVGGGDRS